MPKPKWSAKIQTACESSTWDIPVSSPVKQWTHLFTLYFIIYIYIQTKRKGRPVVVNLALLAKKAPLSILARTRGAVKRSLSHTVHCCWMNCTVCTSRYASDWEFTWRELNIVLATSTAAAQVMCMLFPTWSDPIWSCFQDVCTSIQIQTKRNKLGF